jgi:hypothetical protein
MVEEADTASAEVVAAVAEREPKVWRPLQVLAVVVPKPREKTPVAWLYWIGKVPEIDEEARRPRDEVDVRV